MGMRSDVAAMGDGDLDGCGQFFNRHLGLVWRGAWGEHSAGRNHLNHFGARRKLITHHGPDGVDSGCLAADEPSMTARHADRDASRKNARSGSDAGRNRLFQGKDRMVAKAHVSHGRKPGLKRATRQFGRFQQRQGRRIALHGGDDIRFRSQTQMHVAIDKSRQDRESAAVDPARASRDTNVLIWTNGCNAALLDDERSSLKASAEAIENASLTNGDRHGVSVIGIVTMMPPMMSLSL
jgi:hypothetical protein